MGETEDLSKLTLDQLQKLSPLQKSALLRKHYKLLADARPRFESESYGIPTAVAIYGSAEEALKRYMKASWLLWHQIDNQNFGVPESDWPPVLQAMLNMLRLRWGTLPVEAQVEQVIEERVQKELQSMYAIQGQLLDGAMRIIWYHEQLGGLENRMKELGIKHAEDIRANTEVAKALKDTAKKLGDEVSQYKSRFEGLELELNNYKEKMAKDIEEWDQRLQDMMKERGAALGELESSRAELTNVKTAYDDLKVAFEGTKSALSGLEKTYRNETKELKEQRDLQSSQREVAERERDEFRTMKENLDRVLREVGEKYETLRQDYLTSQDNVRTANNRVAALENEKRAANDLYQAEQQRSEKLAASLRRTKKWAIGGIVGSSVMAAVVYFAHPYISEPKIVPTAHVKPIPAETIHYTGKDVKVSFGDDAFTMSIQTMSNLYNYIKSEEERSGNKLTPAEKKELFEKRSTKYIEK